MDAVGPMYCTNLPLRYCFPRGGSYAQPNAYRVENRPQSELPLPVSLWANRSATVLKCHPLASIRSIRPIKFAVSSSHGSSEEDGLARRPLLSVPVARNQLVCTPLSSNKDLNYSNDLYQESKPDWSAGTVHVLANSLQKLTTRGRRVSSNEFIQHYTVPKKQPVAYSNPFPRSVAKAVCQYIDFLTRDNEHLVEIQNGQTSPTAHMTADLRRERYYQELMCEPIDVPTTRFREWLRCEHNIELELSEMGRFVKGKTFPPLASPMTDQLELKPKHNYCSACGCPKAPSNDTAPKPAKKTRRTVSRSSRALPQELPAFEQPSGFNLLVDAAYQTVVREELIDGISVHSTNSSKNPPNEVTVVTTCHPSTSTWMDALIAASCRQDSIDHSTKAQPANALPKSPHPGPSDLEEATREAVQRLKESPPSQVKQPAELSRKRNRIVFEQEEDGKEAVGNTVPAKTLNLATEQELR